MGQEDHYLPLRRPAVPSGVRGVSLYCVNDSMRRTSKGVERRIAARKAYLAQRAAMPDSFWAAPLWPLPRSVAIREDATLHAGGAFARRT